MSLSIRTNVSSLTAQRNLSANQLTLDSALSRLSSGYRITRAGDDAAGLGISTKLESQIRSYGQATRNANDGLSVVQASESALNEQANVLTRLRELAMQSASDGVGNSERAYIDTESGQLLAELQRIAQVTEYNGTKLLDGTNASGLDFQVGVAGTANDVITVKTLNATTGAAGATGAATLLAARSLARTAFLAAIGTGTPAEQSAALAAAQVAAGAATPGDTGASPGLGWMVGFSVMEAWSAGGVPLLNATANGGTGSDASFAAAFSSLATFLQTSNDLSAGEGQAISSTNFTAGDYAASVFGAAYVAAGGTFSGGFNIAPGAARNAGLAALGAGGGGGGGGATGGLGVAGLSLASKASAQTALGTIDAALEKLSTDRAQLGASGNRLQSAINDIQAFSESLSAANSRIRDVDVAEETSRLSRAQILAQAGVSVLAQANQMPQLALKLLG